MILIQQIPTKEVNSLVESLRQIAEMQHSQQSEWSVNGAAFIVIALFIVVTLGVVFGILIKSMLNQQKQLTQKILNSSDLLQKFQESFDKNTQVLDKVNSYLQKIENLKEERAKMEATSSQLHCFIKASLDAYKFKISNNVLRIIKENNIVDKVKTETKINNLIDNLYKNLITSFNSFLYGGNRVGDVLFDNNWRELQFTLIQDYIYTKERDLSKFHNDLDILFDSIFQEIRQKVDF